MAKAKVPMRAAALTRSVAKRNEVTTHRTSIGSSPHTRPNFKNHRKRYKPNVGQGRP